MIVNCTICNVYHAQGHPTEHLRAKQRDSAKVTNESYDKEKRAIAARKAWKTKRRNRRKQRKPL